MRRSPPHIGVSRTGITLTELLVSIGIIGVLLALLLPAIQKIREAAHQVECANHLRQLGFALHLHTQDHGVLPSNGGWDGKQTIKDINGNQFTPATTDLHAGNTWRWGVGQAGLPPRAQTGSWLYAVLPYLERQAQMEAGSWDRPFNLFHCPSRRRAQSWLACVGRRPPGEGAVPVPLPVGAAPARARVGCWTPTWTGGRTCTGSASG